MHEALPSDEELQEIIQNAYSDVVNNCKDLGINVPPLSELKPILKPSNIEDDVDVSEEEFEDEIQEVRPEDLMVDSHGR